MPDLKKVKSKLDTGLRKSIANNDKRPSTTMSNNFFSKNNANKLGPLNNDKNPDNNDNEKNDLAKEYNDLEKSNQNQLKDFIQTVMMNKKEKRNNYFQSNNVI